MEQAEFLNHPDGRGLQDAQVRDQRQHPSHPQSCALERRESHRSVHCLVRNFIDSFLRHKKHIWPGPNRKLMSLAHALEVFIRVHPDARVSTVQAARDCALYTACEPGFSPLFQHTNLDAGMPQCLACSGAAFLSYMILGPLFLGRPVATGLRPRRPSRTTLATVSSRLCPPEV